MAFTPESITKQHIIDAVKNIEKKNIQLQNSTKFNVIVNGKPYPPKEVMRYAHELMNGEHIWERGGGVPTNKYLTALGFEIISKTEGDETTSLESNFVSLLKIIGREDATLFFDAVENLTNELSVKQGDRRVTFGTTNNKRLSLTVGQRYCLVLVPKEKNPYRFIVQKNRDSTDDVIVSPFDGNPPAYYCSSKKSSNYFDTFLEILEASKSELNRTQASGYRDHNNDIFERAVFDKDYREELFEQAFGKEEKLSGIIWKSGCNWEKHYQSYYGFLKDNKVAIGVDEKRFSVGDLILVTEGFNALSIVKVIEEPTSVTKQNNLKKTFKEFKIPFEDRINVSKVEWYELDEDERFSYHLQAGLRKVQDADVRKKVFELWNNRNTNYWIFQCNPNAFDFETAIRNNLLDDWTVTAHKDKIKAGDKVILWISGSKAGCYALAEVTKEPRIVSTSKDSHLWKTADNIPLKAGIKITHNLIDNPLLWTEINANEGLENLKVGNRGTNFSATKKEYNTLVEIVGNKTGIKNNLDMSSKNIILYGPPGTGKTYNSIDKAVEIATGKMSIHSENKKQFDELRKQGQIEFVTFHQNYSYEDFMVGLRPDADNEQLRFKKHRGIFYELCKRAKENYESFVTGEGKKKSVDEVFEELMKPLESGKEVEIKMISGISFWITEVSDKTIYFRKASGGTQHTLSVNSLKELIEGIRETPSGLAPYYSPIIDLIKSNRETNEKAEPIRKFVLVIDEINRANISKVFGELITLLEDDKRLGCENELKITLPNGEKDFGVPPNLYVIGTMNTADKSIALIDIALRRRFEFIGYYPKYEGYDSVASGLLQKINEGIFKEKKSADYLIGHAYFMNGLSVEIILKNKVVPLLMEYFSGKTDIVSKIFSDTDWAVSYDTTCYTWNISEK